MVSCGDLGDISLLKMFELSNKRVLLLRALMSPSSENISSQTFASSLYTAIKCVDGRANVKRKVK